MSDASAMWKKLWAAYSDFITLDWLLRRLGNEPIRLFGVLLMALALFILYQGVLGVHTGQSVMSTSRSGVMHSSYVTMESRVGYACVSCTIGLAGLLFSLPWRTRPGVGALSLYDLSLLRRPRPIIPLIVRYLRTEDEWLRAPCQPHHRIYAAGSVNPSPWYFTRNSRVNVKGIKSVYDFLTGCTYVSDDEQFDRLDHWQHPIDFERCRRGDCEDHALWAWRKLCESGVDAEFLICRRKTSESATGDYHAVVLVHDADGDLLLETVAKSADQIIRLSSECRNEYVPLFSVDRDFREWVYGGYFARFARQENRA